MADLTIIHKIEAPELTAAIYYLAGALMGRSIENVEHDAPKPVSAPVEVAENPTTTGSAPYDPAAGDVPYIPAGGIATATPVQTGPAVTANPPINPTPVETAKSYTLADITNAGAELLDAGKMNELSALLATMGAQSIVQLKPEQYADVADGLRKLGAHI